MADKKVIVIGGGVAGLSAAVVLANLNISVELVEKSDFLGGHAIGFSCKATRNTCVKCGACMVEEKLQHAVSHSNIKVLTGSRVKAISKNNRFMVKTGRKPQYIDPRKCTTCGICFDQCPAEGAILRGYSQNNFPFFAVNEENCLYIKDKSCSICRDECPENAINLDINGSEYLSKADAVLFCTGFKPFDPSGKPYGYGNFKNVVTSLELERMLRRIGRAKRPSDNLEAKQIGFIQCVGSRDARLNHLWCSKVCCGSALRMARLIKERQPETDITFFYIDVQTFGKDFEQFYQDVQKDVRLMRTIPGDIFEVDNQRLKVTFADNNTHETLDAVFDLVVLSIGITPCTDAEDLARLLHLERGDSGFIAMNGLKTATFGNGVFAAGTVQGPMSIPETIASAGKAAWEIFKYLNPDQPVACEVS